MAGPRPAGARKEATFMEIDEAMTEFYDGTDDVASFASSMPHRHDDKVDTSTGTAGSKEE